MRDPFERFASALIEQMTRFRKPTPHEEMQLKGTKWYRLRVQNASLADIVVAYEIQRYYFVFEYDILFRAVMFVTQSVILPIHGGFMLPLPCGI